MPALRLLSRGLKVSMSYWVKHSEDSRMPEWLGKHLTTKCRLCGSPMLNHYNDGYRCTNRKCSNDNCPGFIAARADFMRKIIGIDGVGYAKCLEAVTVLNATTPLQLLRYWGIKPVVTLEQYLRMHCFEGVDSEWEKITKELNIYTLDELYEKYNGKWKTLLLDNKDLLYENLNYVTLKEKPSNYVDTPSLTITIMITGTPSGFQSKEHFVNTLNEICRGRIVILHQKTKRQSGVHFLIREVGSTTRGKVEAAKKGGIPIVTSEQFICSLTEVLEKLNAEQRKAD